MPMIALVEIIVVGTALVPCVQFWIRRPNGISDKLVHARIIGADIHDAFA